MKIMRIILSAIFAVLLLTPATRAQGQQNLVKAELLANVSAIAPGEPFTVAVKLTITPGWHIYWINPGDSGLPTTVKWDLPDGFKADALQYPAPRRIELPGGLVNYGYEDDAVFLAHITPPSDLKASDDVPIEAKISWLVCKENCIKGGTTAKLSLPAAAKSQAANEADFAKWKRMIPVNADQLSGISINVDPLDISDGSGKTQIKATVPLDNCLAIPGPSDDLTITCGQPKVTANGTTFPVEAKVLAGQKASESSIIVVIVPENLSGGGYQVMIPITQSNKQPSG